MSLRLEAYIKCNLRERNRRVPEQILRTFNASARDKLVGPDARRGPELGGKVHPAEARRTCEIWKADGISKIGFDEIDNTPVPPFRQTRLIGERQIAAPRSRIENFFSLRVLQHSNKSL
jgi:hypothetical protein